MFSGFLLPGGLFLATQRYLHDAEAILGTLKYLSEGLRCKIFRASSEAILGTQRYLHDAEAILGTLKYFLKVLRCKIFRTSGEAILGTQRYLDDATR